MNSVNLFKHTVESVTQVLGLFVASADTSCANSKSDNAAGGGILNFRTEMFDDGTDAFGWYEDD